jgi:BASS family bile acid:Na+ symporter
MLHSLIELLGRHAITALVLSVGLATNTAVIADLARRGNLVLRALAVVWVGVPVFAIAAVALLRLPPLGALALVIVAICPGVPLVLKSASRAHGSRRTALLVLLATAITAPLMIPLWSAVLSRTTHYAVAIDPIEVVRVVVPSVIVPFVVGRLVRIAAPRVAEVLAKIANIVFLAGIAVLLVVAVSKALPVLAAASLRAVMATVLVTLAAFVVGYLAGQPRAEDRTALAYAAALGNPALALAVAAGSFPTSEPLPLIAAYVLVRAAVLIPLGLWLRRRAA